ncbi:hypothetical protein TOPH_06830 [Tolypocladium ophioglossoides CBS 100239]|uniref:Uncharacterized protein n=1 Tax=Tolypocladium ophioglossoides (strain CBS 100239) TaxID=1163406 RepID=A0A0L0N345_TOLOC|nr:hypothetical protein TOPH_06830 [Tolypocladium ophioglossoides CBS 100239]
MITLVMMLAPQQLRDGRLGNSRRGAGEGNRLQLELLQRAEGHLADCLQEDVRRDPAILERQVHGMWEVKEPVRVVPEASWGRHELGILEKGSGQDVHVAMIQARRKLTAADPLKVNALDVGLASNVRVEQSESLGDCLDGRHGLVLDKARRGGGDSSPVGNDGQRDILDARDAVPEVVAAENMQVAAGDLGECQGSDIVEASARGVVDQADDVRLNHGAVCPLEFEQHLHLGHGEVGGYQGVRLSLARGSLEGSEASLMVVCGA